MAYWPFYLTVREFEFVSLRRAVSLSRLSPTHYPSLPFAANEISRSLLSSRTAFSASSECPSTFAPSLFLGFFGTLDARVPIDRPKLVVSLKAGRSPFGIVEIRDMEAICPHEDQAVG